MTGTACRRIGAIWLSVFLVACDARQSGEKVPEQRNRFVVVYTSIDETRAAALYRTFAAETGIRVQHVTADEDGLLQLMLDKTQAPAADLYMAAGVSRLWRAADKGALRPTHAEDLIAAIPARLRDPENQWFGIAVMANVIVFSPSVVAPDELGSYESLAEPRWRGQLCMTSSSLPDNNALIAHLIHRHGHRQAELIVRQLAANLALPALNDPRALFAAMESGRCSVGIVSLAAAANGMAASSAAKPGIATPTLENGGTMVDIIGAGVSRHARNAADAVIFVQWLAGPVAQSIIAESLAALPAVRGAEVPRQLEAWAGLQQSETGVSHLGLLHQDAIDLAERARYH